MHEFTALIKKRGVVFVGFYHEKRIIGEASRNAKIIGYAADEESRI